MATVNGIVSAAKVGYIRMVKRWNTKETCAATLLFEGSRREAAFQRTEVGQVDVHAGFGVYFSASTLVY